MRRQREEVQAGLLLTPAFHTMQHFANPILYYMKCFCSSDFLVGLGEAQCVLGTYSSLIIATSVKLVESGIQVVSQDGVTG